MIDLLTLDCGCQWDAGSWDLCLAHREQGMTNDAGPVPLAGFNSEPTKYVLVHISDEAIPITSAKSLKADPYEASTRQARASRHSRGDARPSGLTAEREARKGDTK